MGEGYSKKSISLVTIGKFKINESQKLPERGLFRGLLIIGEDVDGQLSKGHWITFSTGITEVTMKVAGVEKTITVSGVRFIAFILDYKDEEERKSFESLKLKEQIVEVKEG
jgi:hypothetical protein